MEESSCWIKEEKQEGDEWGRKRRGESYTQIHQLHQRCRTKTERVSGVRGQPVGHQIVRVTVGGGSTMSIKVLNKTEVHRLVCERQEADRFWVEADYCRQVQIEGWFCIVPSE